MGEEKEDKKVVNSSADKSASSSHAKNKVNSSDNPSINQLSKYNQSLNNNDKSKTKRFDADKPKTGSVNNGANYNDNTVKADNNLSTADNTNSSTKASEVKKDSDADFTKTDNKEKSNENTEKKKEKIDYKKIERIKKELMREEKVEPEPESDVPENQIHRKNERLIEDIYRYNRQRTKDIVNLRRESINIVLTVVLILLLVAIITMGVYLYLQKTSTYSKDFIKVSVDMTNKDIFYDAEVSGELIPKDISPGDKYKLVIVARNSEKIEGDEGNDWVTIYLRFRMTLIINGVEYDDFIYIQPDTENWEKYNPEWEAQFPSSPTDPSPVVKEDDGYYYCRKVLWPNDKVVLIDWLRFSETNITEVVGGNDAVLKVQIEALEAIPNIIKNRETWTNAPQHWVKYMTETYVDTGSHQEEENNEINIWWIILFISVAIILIVAIVIVSTRKKKSKAKLVELAHKIKKK